MSVIGKNQVRWEEVKFRRRFCCQRRGKGNKNWERIGRHRVQIVTNGTEVGALILGATRERGRGRYRV